MKPMIYSKEMKSELLASGEYKGYKYYIVSMGTHPCAYIEIPKNSKYYMKHYDLIDDINCHGGLTFSQQYLFLEDEKLLIDHTWFIGWDYAHFGDFIGVYIDIEYILSSNAHLWKTKEIMKEIKDVIIQITHNDPIKNLCYEGKTQHFDISEELFNERT